MNAPAPRIADTARIPQEKPLDTWHALLHEMEHYSFFQTSEWSDILCETIEGALAEHRWLEFSDGNEAVLPLISIPKKFGFRKLESLPWGCYGGLVGKGTGIDHLVCAMNACLSLRKPAASVTLNPCTQVSEKLPVKSVTRETHLLSLDEPFDAIFQTRFQPRCRSAIRKAEKEGITIIHSNAKPHIETLTHLYQKACERWGVALTIPLPFFDALVDRPETQIRVWSAQWKGETVAADVMLYGKGEVQYFAGARDEGFTDVDAAKRLMSECIKDACQNGFKTFNFGGSAGLSGVERFKEIFGGERREYPALRFSKLPLIG